MSEPTSRVAKITARVLAVKPIPGAIVQVHDIGKPYKATFLWSDIRALATQVNKSKK